MHKRQIFQRYDTVRIITGDKRSEVYVTGHTCIVTKGRHVPVETKLKLGSTLSPTKLETQQR